MDHLLDALEASLRTHIEAHRELAALLDEERGALTGLDIDVIHTCINRKAVLAQHIQATERERRRLCRELTQALGLEEGPLRLETLIDHLPQWRRPALMHLRAELLEAMRLASDGNGRNRTLTVRFLSVLRDSMTAVQAAVATLPLYSSAAKVSQANWRGCVLKQTA